MNSKVKIGVFGCSRGQDFIKILNLLDNVEIAAICEGNEPRLGRAKALCSESTKTFTNFDEFIDSGLDGVILCNHFNDHAPYAMKALKKGIAVLSETTSASTMEECVQLVRTVEETGTKYMLAENYPFFAVNQEMKRIYDTGKLGRVLYAEGEYCHPMDTAMLNMIAATHDHWRSWMPRTYYLTHALGPLMYITGDTPRVLNARTVFAPELYVGTDRQGADAVSIMLAQTDSGALFRFTGTAAIAPHGNWYRVSCTKGGVESVRGDEESVRIGYNGWEKPEDEKEFDTYKAQWTSNGDLAEKAGHNGGDFWVCFNFIKYITDDVKPFFDVYRGTLMSATGIQAWRSSLNHGAEYRIPDFRNEADRIEFENDCDSPFPGAKRQILPACSHFYVPTGKKEQEK